MVAPQLPPGPQPGPPPQQQPQPGQQALAQLLPPPVLQRLLAALPPEARAQFPTLPVAAQNDLLLGAAERLGLIPPAGGGPTPQPVGPGGPPPGPGPMPGPGPVPGPIVGPTGPAPGVIAPRPQLMPPPGTVVAGGGPPLLAHGGPPHAGGTPPPIDLAARRPPKPVATGPKLPEEEPPPDDWEPEALEDLQGANYAWKTAPTVEQLSALAEDALADEFWKERNQSCYEQARCYYRSKHWWKLNGRPFSNIEGDLLYMLSTPAKQLDRIVARTKPDDTHVVFQLDARSEREEYKDAAANAENWCRDKWAGHIVSHHEEVSQSGPDADLPRKIAFLAALHGTVGWSLRANTRRRKGSKKRDINADRPLQLSVIPWHELYLFGDCTIRIQSVTLREARRMSKDVREKWPTLKKGEEKPKGWYPPDDHRCLLIAFSDRMGKWYGQSFDLCGAETGRDGRDDERFWLTKPQQMNYGFCLFQAPPGWQSTGDNALPDERQAAENYGANMARGVLFSNLWDFAIQDQIASAALSTFRYNRNPGVVDIVDAQTRQAMNEPLPPPFKGLEGERQTRFKDELPVAIQKHFADSAGDNFLMSMAFGQTADTFPAALGGGGDAQSGYDRRQMVENAQLLHVEELREFVAHMVQAISRRSLELMHRLGTGDKKVFDKLTFRRSTGGKGEGTLSTDDIEKAGVGITTEYHEEDLDKELRLNNIVLPRVDKKVISMERAREMLGEPEPKREEERLDEEMALTHPAMQEVKAIAAMLKSRPEWAPFLLEALHRNAQGQQIQQPGMPSMPGGGGPQPTPQPGVPAGNLPSAAQGLPPGMRQPQGVGV